MMILGQPEDGRPVLKRLIRLDIVVLFQDALLVVRLVRVRLPELEARPGRLRREGLPGGHVLLLLKVVKV